MSDENKPKNREKIFIYVSVILIILIVSLGGIYLVFSQFNLDAGPTLATEYKNVTPSKAYEVFTASNKEGNEAKNLTIIDARRFDWTCDCTLDPEFEAGHLPGAILDKNPAAENYYNITTDIIVYTHEGSNEKAQEFCNALIGHIYGKIYLLKGGYLSWKEAGYEIETGPPSQ